MESIYAQCSSAARRLLNTGDPLTESDVVLEAADDSWTEDDYAEADKHAPQVLATLYRNVRVVRFGIVSADDAPMTREDDYVRREGKIVYADAESWSDMRLDTPNGSFDIIRFRADPIFKTGRRRSSGRDDFTSWDDQGLTPQEQVAKLRQRVMELEAQERQAHRV